MSNSDISRFTSITASGVFQDNKQMVSTWLERVVLIAILEPKSLLLWVISPQNPLNLYEQVLTKSLGNACISVNRSRAIYGFFTVLDVLPMVIGQRHLGNRKQFPNRPSCYFTISFYSNLSEILTGSIITVPFLLFIRKRSCQFDIFL